MATATELKQQGMDSYSRKDYDEAARLFQAAQEAFKTEEDKQVDAAEMSVNLGLVHRAKGEHQQALEAMESALSLFQEQGDALRTAQVLGNMGGVYLELNDNEQAFGCYRQAADVFQELGETQMYAQTLKAMAAIQVKSGKMMHGASTYEEALQHLDGEMNRPQKLLKRVIGWRNKVLGK